MDRGHGEDAASAAGFEVSHLNDDRQRLQDKHQANKRQKNNESLLNRHRGECEPDPRIPRRRRLREGKELPEGLELAARRLPCPSLDGGAVKRFRVPTGRAFLGAHAA